MPDLEFLMTGKTSSGGLDVRYVTAASAADAVRRLEEEGLRDVQLVEDETTAITRAVAAQEAARAGLSPALLDPVRAYAGRRQRLGALPRLLVALQSIQIWIWVPVLVVAFCLTRSAKQALPVVIGASVAWAALRLGTWRWELLLTYERLLLALRRNDGRRALKLLDSWEKSIDTLKIRHAIGTLEIITYRARCLAALGQRDEAISTLARIKDELAAPEWVYWLRRCTVHTQLVEHDAARDALLKTIETGPPCATPHLDLALLLALRLRDAIGARTHLDRALALPLAEAARWYAPLVEAAVLLEEGRADTAELRLARVDLGELPPTAGLLMQDAVAVLRCLVAGSLGRKTEARQQLAAVEPILQARRDQMLLERCRAAAG